MQVGISQLIMPAGTTMAEFFRQSVAAGYEVAELCMRREGELTPSTTPDQLQAIVNEARAAGIELVSMTHSHLTGNLLASGPEQQRGLDETAAGLEAASALGLGCTLHTLGKLSADVCYDDAYANAVRSLSTLAATAERLKVKIAVEFVWNGFAFSPLEMKRLLDEVGSDHVGFYFDPGNMAVFQYPHHWVKILGRHTMMVHMKDFVGGPLNGRWPALTEGEVDYAAVNRELRAIGYDGPLISEVPPADAPLDKTAAAIRRIMTM